MQNLERAACVHQRQYGARATASLQRRKSKYTEIHDVIIEKSNPNIPLGLDLVTKPKGRRGSSITVTGIHPNGAALQCLNDTNRLVLGDRILLINNRDVMSMSPQQCLTAMRSSSRLVLRVGSGKTYAPPRGSGNPLNSLDGSVVVACPACTVEIAIPRNAPQVRCGICNAIFNVTVSISGSQSLIHIAGHTPVDPTERWRGTVLDPLASAQRSGTPFIQFAPLNPSLQSVHQDRGTHIAASTTAVFGQSGQNDDEIAVPPSYEESEIEFSRLNIGAMAPLSPNESIGAQSLSIDTFTVELELTGRLVLGVDLAFIKNGPRIQSAVVCDILRESAAALTRQIQTGDTVHSVNDIPVTRMSKEECLVQLSSNPIKLLLSREQQ